MKRFTGIICFSFIFSSAFSQAQYEISYDKTRNNVKVLTGIINKYLVMNDSAYKWYANNQKGYSVKDLQVLDVFEKTKNDVQYMIFGGTWCEDTQVIVPRFFKIQEQSGVPDNRVTFIGVNGNKKTLGNLTEAMNITNVPTIIVMKGGKEVGRVIEYGKTGNWEKELVEILKGVK